MRVNVKVYQVVVALLAGCFAAWANAQESPQQLWITNSLGNDVHVYEIGSWKLLRRIEVGPNPHGISATADGKTVHIALENFQGERGELIWVDVASGDVVGRVAVGPKPNENECTPDGKWIYVPCEDGKYWVVDGEQRTIATKIDTGGRPHNTTISPDGKRMYLSPMGTPKKVTIVDIDAGHQVIGEIPFAAVLRPPAISADEKFFVQHEDDLLGFEVADVAERKVIKRVQHEIPAEQRSIASRCHGLAVRPDQKEIWSCDVEHFTVHIHEFGNEFASRGRMTLPGRIYWVCFTPDSKYAFVSVRSRKQVAVIDTATRRVVTMLAAGNEPKRTQVIVQRSPASRN